MVTCDPLPVTCQQRKEKKLAFFSSNKSDIVFQNFFFDQKYIIWVSFYKPLKTCNLIIVVVFILGPVSQNLFLTLMCTST